MSGADICQVLAYADRYRAERAVLVHRHHPVVGVPGIQREFWMQGADSTYVRVKVVAVDLRRLESVPGQLELGLTS